MTELKSGLKTERARGKTIVQDAIGILFCGIGLFFAVSIVLFSFGWTSKPGLISTFTWPVIELVAQLGHASAVLFSLGLTALGTILFLRPAATSLLRPVVALLVASLGAALLLGAFGKGGGLGDWLPGLLTGVAGRTLSLVLGAALLWLGWTLIGERTSHGNTADALQRLGLSARQDAAAGVSSAEAALLVTDPRPAVSRSAAPRSIPRREETPGGERAPKPDAAASPSKALPPSGGRPEVVPLTKKPLVRKLEDRVEPLAPEPLPAWSEAEGADVPPPTPSWEEPVEEASAEPEAEAQFEAEALAHELAPLVEPQDHPFEEEPAEEEPAHDVTVDLGEAPGVEDEEEPAIGDPLVPRPSWEQVGLFEEEEPEEEEEEPERRLPAPRSAADLTRSFDFGVSEPERHLHEPEPGEDPFAELSAPAASVAAVDRLDPDSGPAQEPALPEEVVEPSTPVLAEKEVAAKPPRKRAKKSESKAEEPPADFLLQPVPARSASEGPTSGSDEESEAWNQLVFEAGCAILEQKRVAVSMLERRFGIDFDRACLVLDHLQQAGLIGPYLGGRTREILLDSEAWNSRTPQAPESR